MKLHLPKTLLAAVITAISFSMTAQAGSTGWLDGEFYFDATGRLDANTNLNQNGLTDIAVVDGVTTIGSADASSWGDLKFFADVENNSSVKAKIGTLTVADNVNLKVMKPAWGPRSFASLTIDNLIVKNSGKANLHVEYIKGENETQYTNNVFINNVTGSIGTVAVATGGSLTIGSASGTTTFSGAITNTGTLTINGAISFKVDASSNFETVGGVETTYSYNSEKEEGFKSVAGAQYELIGENTGTISITAEQEGLTVTKDETTGNVTSVIFSAAGYTGDTFRINGSSLDEAALIEATASTGVTATTKYELVAGTLTVAGDISTDRLSYSGGTLALGSNTLTIADGNAQLLLNTTGAGNVTLTANLALAPQQATQATGKLTISNGAQLNLGNSDLWNASTSTAGTGASISSFTAVELDNGTIRIQNPDATIKNLTVTTNGGVIDANDLANDTSKYKINLFGNTTLNGNLTYKNQWNTYTEVENLTGSGNLIIDGANRDSQDTSTFSILKATDYQGEVQMTNKANNMALSVAQNLGLNVRVQTTSGEINLSEIGSGNTVILNGAVGGIKNGKVVADVKFENTTQRAGMDITSAADENSVEYAGTVSGSGNYLIGATKTVTVTNDDQTTSEQTVDVMTNTTFSGDTSGYTGQMRITRGEHNITFTGSATSMNNSWVVDDGATANVNLNHAAAATVSKAMSPAGTGVLNLTVTNSSDAGTKLAAGAKLNNLTVGDNTKLVLGGATTAATATLGDGASLHFDGGSLNVAGSLTLNALSIDLSKYSTDQEIHTLVSAGTLSLGAGVNLSSLGGNVGNYTATVAQSGNTITLSLKLEDVTSTDWSLVGTPSYDADGNMLTLNVGANLLDYDFTNNGAIIIPGIDDAMMKDILGLGGLPEGGMVGITLLGGDGESVTATADQQIGFQGKDGGIYFGGMVGSNWQYQVAYIPEPATATLSLLALAGLAARRRRKA